MIRIPVVENSLGCVPNIIKYRHVLVRRPPYNVQSRLGMGKHSSNTVWARVCPNLVLNFDATDGERMYHRMSNRSRHCSLYPLPVCRWLPRYINCIYTFTHPFLVLGSIYTHLVVVIDVAHRRMSRICSKVERSGPSRSRPLLNATPPFGSLTSVLPSDANWLLH